MLSRVSLVVMCGALAAVGLAAPASADGGHLPSTAPDIVLGQSYFGDNSDYTCRTVDACRIDMWRLPALLAQDAVTVAWRNTSDDGGPYLCISGNVDDYSWLQGKCNLSTRVFAGTAGKREPFLVPSAAASAYLELIDYYGGNYGPYQFTVESIQHQVGLGLASVQSVGRKGSVRATATLTNNAPVADGFDVALIIRKGDKKWVRVGYASAGQVTFKLKLAKSAKGKVKLSLSRGADPQYLAASTRSMKTRIT